MAPLFQLTPLAFADLDQIWRYIAADNRPSADRVEAEIMTTCRELAHHPLMGRTRPDITLSPLRFWTVTQFPSYMIVYRPETKPLQIVAVLHGKRNVKDILSERGK